MTDSAGRRVAITGSSGLVGQALREDLQRAGWTVIRVVRRATRSGEVSWDPARGEIDADAMEGLDAVVHLAGEPIAGGLWTAERRRRIRESRVQGTLLLTTTLAGLHDPPRTLVSSSAVGYYGDRGDAILDESAGAAPDGFLPEVASQWEAATRPATEAGVRVAIIRSGVVLSTEGGALPLMLRPFRLGLGGPLGSGRQWMPWISRRDLVGVIRELLSQPELEGPFNAVAPDLVTNATFSHTLAQILDRPAFISVPRGVLELLLGDLARETLLASARVVPRRLEDAGYPFKDPFLEPTLRRLLE